MDQEYKRKKYKLLISGMKKETSLWTNVLKKKITMEN